MKYLAPIPKQFVDQNGLPLSNGTVHVYISGDTQYANVYQDADGEELMPNPARLDSNGAWLGFVTAGVPLDYVVEDKDGNVQFEYEKVVAGNGTANVAIEPVLTSGTKIAECWVDGELLELFAPEGGGTQVQADWAQTDSSAADYIKNKPAIPSQFIALRKVNDTANASRYVKIAELSPSISDNYIYHYDLSVLVSCSTGQGNGEENESGRFDLNVACSKNSNVYYATGRWVGYNGDSLASQYKKIEGVVLLKQMVDGGSYADTLTKMEVWLKVNNELSYMQNASISVVLNQGSRQYPSNYPTKSYYQNPWVVSSGSQWLTTTEPSGDSTAPNFFNLTDFPAVGGQQDCKQFVLVRSDMTTNFTNEEYQDCTDAVAAGQAVCVQFVRNSRTFQVQLTQVETDTGLLVFEVDVANIHITYEVSGTNNAHSITEIDYQNGTPIFDTLQDAITWAAVLHNGDIFETNGFYTSGDGGAARYKVSSTGTANGMDIVQLAAGKLAHLQVTSDGLYPEQLGYVPTKVYADRVDCTPTFNRIWALCDTVRLHKGRYWFYDYLTLPASGKIIGENVYGDDVSEMSTYRSGDYFVYCENRENVIENVVLSNRHNNGNLPPVNTGGVGIGSNEWLHDGAAHFDYAFRHLRLMGFRKGMELQGTTKWAVTLYDIRCSQCYIGIEFGEASFNIDLHKIYTDHCTYAGINFHGEGVFGFYDCNLGCINTAVKVSEYGGSQYTDILLTFVNTNFECDDQSLVNIPGLYFDIDDALDVILNMYGCRFMQNAGVYTASNRCMKLGAKTLVNMKGCEVRNNTGVAQADDNFWNENYPCKFTLGAIRISDNCRGVPTPQFTDSKFDLCCVETDLTEMEIISQGGGGTPVNNLWDNSSPTILAGYVSEANGDHPNGFFTLNNSTQMTLAIPITNYMQGQTIRISAGTTSHNRWKYGKVGAIPTATVTDLTYVGNTSTDSSGRTYSDIPVGATETGYILIFFGSGISSTDIIADAMACVSPYYTPYESYQGGTTTYSRQLRTGLINLDELVTALNLRGNSLV